MNGSTTDIIVARAHDVDRLSTMIVWSIGAHIVVTALIVLLPHPQTDLAPKEVMTISLGGPSGPRTGMTPMGQRAVQAPLPEEAVKKAPSAPAPVTPEMTLPNPRSKPRQAVKEAPKDATAKTPSTGETPQPGLAKAETRVRGQGFGLSGGGGGAGGVQLDVADFCCPEYILTMKSMIEQNWSRNQGYVGITTVKFTIRSDGAIEGIQLEKSSGFAVLDNEATRALLRTMRLQPLPRAYPNPTLTVHLGFAYERP